jgi:predicted TIM-barrel fold metal-dependent hydrolase
MTATDTGVEAAPTVKTPVDFHIPQGACDCHVHVFDPIRFPYASGRIYTPPAASLNDLRALQSALRFDRVVVIAPSVYGTDNSCTIDAVRQLGARARGVVVLDDSTTAFQLDEMAEAGIHGARLNLETTQDTDVEAASRALSLLAGKLSGRDWHLQFDTRLSVIVALMDEIRSFPHPIVFSHFARARAALGPHQPGFDGLLELLRSGRIYVKISAPYRTSSQSPDFPDVAPLARAIVDANPDRVLWGSNWPHPGRASTTTAIASPYPNHDGHVLNLLPVWIADPLTRRKILIDNPARLYRF